MSADLKTLCSDVAQAAHKAIDWTNHEANADLIGGEGKPIRREINRLSRRAKKLVQAAARPMCVSVFGPSQAGKSFLVSVLARPEAGRLTSDFPDPDGRLDFISEINPEGEGESTGIVTRFTIVTYQAPQGFPIKLRLLSEADVGRILANTFLMDGDKSETEPTVEEIDTLFQKLRPRAQETATKGLTAEDVSETQEYVQKGFGRSTYVAALNDFWEEAVDLGPRLSVGDRAELFSLIWGRHEAFTRLYERLARALEALDGEGEVFARLDALKPRETSIVDVKQLLGLDQEGGPTLDLSTQSGRIATLPRSVVSALTAELVMPMAERPHDFFNGTDLLDFPGARTRFEVTLGNFLSKASTPLKECFLRGKVAFLFDRYVAEQEITSMLLCIQDSNMEVADLPRLVSDWITHTHGATPEQRGSVEKLLFFVLTKFDKHLIDSAGSSDDASTRFQRRMEISFEKFATMDSSWPKNWSGGRAFDNCYWLRNPNYPAESVIEYDAGREVGYLTSKESRLAALKTGCLSAEWVRMHFREPEAAWDAAMALNDGGTGYLVKNLTPVCRPEIKAQQIASQLEETATRLMSILARFHLSDDLSQVLEERRAAAEALMSHLLQVYNDRRFGAVLDEMKVHPEQLADRMKRPPSNIRFVAGRQMASPPAPTRGPTLPGRSSPPAGPARGSIVLPGSGTVAAPPPVEGRDQPKADAFRSLTRAEWRAEICFVTWADRLKTFSNDDDLQSRFSLSPQAANEMTGELIAAARRLQIETEIGEELEANAFYRRGDAGVAMAATIAAERLNAFVATAGANWLDEADRPDVVLEGGRRKPFAPGPQHEGVEDLAEHPVRADADYLTDWMHMIYRQFEDNAKDTSSGKVDPEQNLILGAILKTLEEAGALR